jgi:hypothetical protein
VVYRRWCYGTDEEPKLLTTQRRIIMETEKFEAFMERIRERLLNDEVKSENKPTAENV